MVIHLVLISTCVFRKPSTQFTRKKYLSQRGEKWRSHSFIFVYVVYGQPLNDTGHRWATAIVGQCLFLLAFYFFSTFQKNTVFGPIQILAFQQKSW